MQCVPELWVNRLPDTEPQGGCPDRGRVRAERPGAKGLDCTGVNVAMAQGAERAAAGEPGGVRLEQGPAQEGSGRLWPGVWTQFEEWWGHFERL